MSTVDMQSAIQRMRVMAGQAAGPGAAPGKADDKATTGGFGDALQASLGRINDLQQAAGDEAKAFQAGKPGVELYDVMIDLQKAGLAFQMGVQMRNRLVNAYKDVMNMQV